jgi:hypothetical protein
MFVAMSIANHNINIITSSHCVELINIVNQITAIITLAYCTELLDPASIDSSISSDSSINNF